MPTLTWTFAGARRRHAGALSPFERVLGSHPDRRSYSAQAASRASARRRSTPRSYSALASSLLLTPSSRRTADQATLRDLPRPRPRPRLAG